MTSTRVWVERLARILDDKKLDSVDYVYASVLLGVSPSKAREVLRAFALLKEGWVYERGVLRRVEVAEA